MLEDFFQKKLQAQRQQFLYRERGLIAGEYRGKGLISFGSNDYLNLANHPLIVKEFQKGAEKFGVGSGGSQLIYGYSSAHRDLESDFADFLRRDRVLIFSSGYMANLGIIAALSTRKSIIYQDRLNHASLLDAGILARGKVCRYPHLDTDYLNKKLISDNSEIKLIATDGVFSMSGDIAPLLQLGNVAKTAGGLLIVDDAHGIGVLGKTGGGTVENFKCEQTDVPILTFSLAKAFGCSGAIVAGSEILIESLIQFARTYVFTSAIPPALACAIRASLQLVRTQTWRREKLCFLIQYFKKTAKELGLNFVASATPIQSLIIGKPQETIWLQNQLLAKGFQVAAVRPPTVSQGTSRLRITLHCEHQETQIARLLEVLLFLIKQKEYAAC